jgi:transcriptional regulator GlxA family with amidase domain
MNNVAVYVVLPPRTLLLDVAGPVEVLRRANLEQSQTLFNVTYVGVDTTVQSSIGLTLANIQPLPDVLPPQAVVMVMGCVDQVLQAPANQSPQATDETRIVNWLREKITPDHKLVTICSGALFAARAGLLDGRNCTTHHEDCDLLATIAPRAKVQRNRLYIHDANVYTCAGVTAGVDLMLSFLNEWTGPEVVLAVARFLVVYIRRAGADPQLSPWLEGRNHLHPAVHRVQDAIAQNPAKAWTRKELAHVAGASGRHLARLFHEHVGMPVVDYRNRLRVAVARELITTSHLDMEQVAERAGFESTRQLRRAWSKIYPTSPRESRPSTTKAPSTQTSSKGASFAIPTTTYSSDRTAYLH